MGVIDSFKKFSDERVRYKELCDLRDKSYKIVEYPSFYPLNVMEETIEKSLEPLCEKLYVYPSFREISEAFCKLQSGHINRDQFAEKAEVQFALIDSKLKKIQSSLESNAKEFSTGYNDFFSAGAQNEKDFGKRIVYMILMQPEAKEIIMEFLKL